MNVYGWQATDALTITTLQGASVVSSSLDMNDAWHFGHAIGSSGGTCSSEGVLTCTSAGGCTASASLTGIPTGGSQYVVFVPGLRFTADSSTGLTPAPVYCADS